MKYVYEFTNKRKLTKKEFIHWFQKKFLYTIRKFKMIEKEDVVAYENKGDFRSVVLESLLNLYAEKGIIDVIKLSKSRKFNKKAVSNTADIEADKLIQHIVKGKLDSLNKFAPVNKKVIKPLFLFLDKEVELYAKLIGLKYKKTKPKTDKLGKFVNDLEKKHPEIKHSIVKSYLELL